MKHLLTNILLPCLLLSAFVCIPLQSEGQDAKKANEVPGFIQDCKNISHASVLDYSKRYNALNSDKKLLLGKMVIEIYAKKNLAYDETHLGILFKSVESFSQEITQEYLGKLEK